jgi:endo-1,4-beta-D-glucanase Y
MFSHIHRSTVPPFNQQKPRPPADPILKSDPLFNHSNDSAIRLTREVNLGQLANPPRNFSDSLYRYNQKQKEAGQKTMFSQEAEQVYSHWIQRKSKQALKSPSQDSLTTLVGNSKRTETKLDKSPFRDSLLKL